MKSFSELGLNDNIVNGLNMEGITVPTKIQELTINRVLNNKDVIGESCTGSGKTLAFLAPLIQKINNTKKELQALIIVPTHELVMQINNEIKLLSKNSSIAINSMAIIGDVNIDKQIKKLKETKPQIIVGTCGRILDLIKKKKIKPHTVKTIVLDEADNLLDNTSKNICKDLIKKAMRDTQILAYSATINDNTLKSLKEIMKEPFIVKNNNEPSLNPNIEHMYIEVDERDRFEVLRKLINAENPVKTIVFINRNYEINKLINDLSFHNKKAFALHKGISKEQRQNALLNFRNGKINILISSDLSARGLDIQGVTHIVNLDFPKNANEYLHRAGRTARGNNHGKAISLVTNKEVPKLLSYGKKFNIKIEKKTLKFGELK